MPAANRALPRASGRRCPRRCTGCTAEVLATGASLREDSLTLTSPMSNATAARPTLRIELGRDAAFQSGVPVLGGPGTENLFASARPAGRLGDLALFATEDLRLGAATVSLVDGLEAAAHRIYDQVFEAAGNLHLVRIWNYVPAINEPGNGGMENYQLFCRGRSLAFEEHFGKGFNTILPSASAVGRSPDALTVVFAAGETQPRHVENPLQMAAYDYPPEYGPRSPSFARATIVPAADSATAFVSGTSAIRGHETVAPHDIRAQLECTLENMREISIACGLGPEMDREGNSGRYFKVYLRNASDLQWVSSTLGHKLLKPADRIVYLHAGICRAPLLVEIEATLFGVAGLR